MSNRRTALAALVLLSMLGAQASAKPFSFVALGDTTYSIPKDYPLYEKLIASINDAKPAFSIHVGDTKGWGDCGKAFQDTQRAFFDSYAQPVIYTPGNNEWADCWKDNRGAADPTEILELMREVFWSKNESLGQRRLQLVRESDEIPEFAEFKENARWTFAGATFATLNLTGIHWVIVGGESGPRARPLQPEWVRSIRNQCVAAGVPFFFKQWGGVRKHVTGRVLDGRTWDEMPG